MEPVAAQMRLKVMHLPPDFRALALDQDGVFTAADAREHGVNRSAVHRRVRAGE